MSLNDKAWEQIKKRYAHPPALQNKCVVCSTTYHDLRAVIDELQDLKDGLQNEFVAAYKVELVKQTVAKHMKELYDLNK